MLETVFSSSNASSYHCILFAIEWFAYVKNSVWSGSTWSVHVMWITALTCSLVGHGYIPPQTAEIADVAFDRDVNDFTG